MYDLRMHARGAGCGLKLPAQQLEEVLKKTGCQGSNLSLLAGVSDRYDYGAIEFKGFALVQSVDLIAPVCAEAKAFGEIAAVHSLSDVYASGASPICALAVLVLPELGPPLSVVSELMEAIEGRLMVEGCSLLGGHTTRAGENLLVGLAVTGWNVEEELLKPSRARDGDTLILTKPIGTGIYIAADRSGHQGLDFDAALSVMSQSNRCIYNIRQRVAVHAAVDVAGFGLSDALSRIAAQSHVNIKISFKAVPLLRHARELAMEGYHTRLTDENYSSTRDVLDLSDLSAAEATLMNDPQTSGGLLLAVPSNQASEAIDICREAGFSRATVIGSCDRAGAGSAVVITK